MQNDTNGESAHEKLKHLSGVSQEKHNNIISDLSKKFAVKDPSDYERFIKEVQRRIKNIRDYATLLIDADRDKGFDVERKMLVEEVFKKTLENFSHYSKDELTMIVAQSFSETILNEVI